MIFCRKGILKQLKNLQKSGFSTTAERADFIPVVNFDKFLKGNLKDKKVIGQEVLDAFISCGFVYLKDPGIPQQQLDEVFSLSKQFFQLPIEYKNTLQWDSAQSNRGYSSVGQEKLSELDKEGKSDEIMILQQKQPDQKETFEVGNDRQDQKYKNKWPEQIPGFKEKILKHWGDLHQLNQNIMRCISLGLGLQLNDLDHYIDKADNNLRILHYPSIPVKVLDNCQRAGAHCDYGTITILFQDDIGGLQVKNPNTGIFQNAIPIEGTCNVNVGDMLSRISNDMLRSTLHQVVEPFKVDQNDPTKYPSRFSMAYFCNVNFDLTVDCLPNTFNESNPKKYKPINSFDYLVGRLSATHY